MATFVELILTVLQKQAEITVAALDTLLSDPHELRSKRYRLYAYGPPGFKTNWADAYRRRRKFYDTLNYLKREGLVKKKKGGRNSRWVVTSLGRERIEKMKEYQRDPLSSANSYFSNPRGRGLTVVAFDIPERERRKRKWIRSSLMHMGFRFLQKSVWVGTGQVDEEFVLALRERDMLEYVHLFSVDSRGTVKEVYQ